MHETVKKTKTQQQYLVATYRTALVHAHFHQVSVVHRQIGVYIIMIQIGVTVL